MLHKSASSNMAYIKFAIAITVVFFLMLNFSFSSTDPKKNPKKEKSETEFQKLDVMPQVDISQLAKLIKYPEEARKKGIEGIVNVKAFVNEKGKVEKVKIEKSANKIFNNAAIDAVKNASYTPGKIKDKNVGAWVVIPINFKLQDKKK